jgi:flagellar protein FliO/FliZ
MNLLRLSLLLLVCGLLCLAPLVMSGAEKPVTAPAAGEVIYPRTTGSPAAIPAERGSGYTAVLVAAGLMAAAGGWLFWRGRSAPGGLAAARRLAIAETKSLGNRQYLVVATYEDKKFLLGVCPGRIELLTPLETAEAGEKPRT